MKLTLKLRFALLAGLILSSAGVRAEVNIEQGYFRASPPGVSTAAVFLSAHNSGTAPISITAAQTPAASNAELHNHIEHEGMLQMRQVDAIEIPAQGSVRLQPGGYHIMLIGLKTALKEGDEQMLMLTLSSGEMIHLTLPVRKIQPTAESEKKHHQPHNMPMSMPKP
ncbi:MAG: copper chaperone PCu(A)C [Motiliproteus sp.]